MKAELGLWILTCVLAPLGTAQIATVQVRLNTDYDDSPQSLILMEAIAKFAPLREATVVRGDTLDAIIMREYNFGKSNLPKSYALLRPIILAKNNLSRPEDLLPGTLVIPGLPKRTNADWGRENPRNYMANMYVYAMGTAAPAAASRNRKGLDASAGLDTMERPPSEIVYKTLQSVGETRKNTPFAVVTLETSPKVAVDLAESKVLPEGSISVTDFPMPMKLAADTRCDTEPNTHPTLTEEQRNAIRLIMQQSKRSPVVFVLDTGWPSEDAYKESTAGLNQILTAVWDHEFGAKFQPHAKTQDLAPANNRHCRCIERALQELRALDEGLDATKRVRVLYLPLTREQNADGVLIDLLTTWKLLLAKSGEDVETQQKTTDDIRKAVAAFVTDKKKKPFPEKWEGEEVVTDKSVLDAVLMIGQAYARLTDAVFFVNESWTVRHPDYGGQYYVGYQTPLYGLVTAATGNDGTMTLLDFAQRSPSAKDTMAILNMKQGVLDDTSTRMPPAAIDASLAAAFDGYVTDDLFGTSFAAPRIAWFLAAGEAVRARPISLGDWGWQLEQTLARLRRPQVTSYDKLFFDPVRYITDQAGLHNTGTR